MAIKPSTIRIPPEMKAAAHKRMAANHYETLSDYIIGLIRYDVMANKPHLVTQPMSQVDAKTQKALDRGIISGEATDKEKMSFLEHLIGDSASVIAMQITDALPAIIRESVLSNNPINKAGIEKRIREAVSKPSLKKSSKPLTAIVRTDPEGRVTHFDESFTRMCGYSLSELRGKKPGHILQGKATDKKTVAKFRESIETRKPFVGTLINYHKDGSPYRVRIKMHPVFDKDKHLLAFEAEETLLNRGNN